MAFFGDDNAMKDKIAYLEDERKKTWNRITTLEKQTETISGLLNSLEDRINKRTPEIESEARQHSKKASEFRNRSEEAKDQALAHLNYIEELVSDFNKIKETADRILAEIKNFESSARDNENKIQEFCDLIEEQAEKQEELDSLYNDLPDIQTKINSITETLTSAEDLSSKIKTISKKLSEQHKEIKDIHKEIFGYPENDEEEAIEGLKDQLEASYNEIKLSLASASKDLNLLKENTLKQLNLFKDDKQDEFNETLSNWEANYQRSIDKIHELLPSATTAGLSAAYSAKKEEEKIERSRHSKLFNISIIGMIAVSIIPFAAGTYMVINGLTWIQAIHEMPRLALCVMPLYAPILWVAYSSSVKMNLSKRLIEEYAHKEALSKTYEGLSRQISKLDDNTETLNLKNKLLYSILEINSENPGKLISDYNKADHPLMDALDKSVKLTNAVDKVLNIPGFAKFADVVLKRADKIRSNEEDKANQGLDLIAPDKEDDTSDKLLAS